MQSGAVPEPMKWQQVKCSVRELGLPSFTVADGRISSYWLKQNSELEESCSSDESPETQRVRVSTRNEDHYYSDGSVTLNSMAAGMAAAANASVQNNLQVLVADTMTDTNQEMQMIVTPLSDNQPMQANNQYMQNMQIDNVDVEVPPNVQAPPAVQDVQFSCGCMEKPIAFARNGVEMAMSPEQILLETYGLVQEMYSYNEEVRKERDMLKEFVVKATAMLAERSGPQEHAPEASKETKIIGALFPLQNEAELVAANKYLAMPVFVNAFVSNCE